MSRSKWTTDLTQLWSGKKETGELMRELKSHGCWEGCRNSKNHLILRHIPSKTTVSLGATTRGYGHARGVRATLDRIERTGRNTT